MDWKLEVVVVPVSDVDRAKEFYADRLGFAVDTDFAPNENFRVVQVTPPGSACSIVFGRGLPTGAPLKGSQFVVQDIAAAADHLSSAGVEHSGLVHFADGVMTPGRDPQDQDFGTFVFFDDPDGNTWSVQQGRRAPG
jgi:catechol 2,3-dioxygenase-like lactoylglutathione lyase family enzyme